MSFLRVILFIELAISCAGAATAAPNGYVVEYNGGVAIVDTAFNTLVANTLNVGSDAWSVAISPDGSRVYTYSTGGQITIINASNNTIITQVSVGCTNDSWITISPDGAFLYIACQATGKILVFDTLTNIVIAFIPIPSGNFTDLVTNQAGTRLYVADYGNSVIQVIDTSNPATPVVLTPLNVNPSGANGIAFSNSQNRLYVPRPPNNDLAVINIGSNVVTSITASGRNVSTDPNGTRVYLSDDNTGDVTAIDTATNAILGIFNSGTGVYSSGVHPTNGRIYVLNQQQNNIWVFDPNTPAFSLVTTIPITIPSTFIEPRINGRWMGPATQSTGPAQPVPIFTPWSFAMLALMLAVIGGVLAVRQRFP